MDVATLQKQLDNYTNSLLNDEILDDQFKQLHQLQDENNPDFVVEVVSLFFKDSDRLLYELAQCLTQEVVDFRKVDAHVHQLKGSSSSIGAHRVQKACITFRSYCEQENIQMCIQCLNQVKFEYSLVKDRLETLFKLQQQIQASSTGSGVQSNTR